MSVSAAQFAHAGHPLLGDGKYGKLDKRFDSVTALLQNEIFPPEKNYALDLPAAERCARELLEFVRSVRSVVLVSDYIFSDAGEYDPMTEQYRRALAGIDRMLARECDTVVELAAGRRIVHKGVLPF